MTMNTEVEDTLPVSEIGQSNYAHRRMNSNNTCQPHDASKETSVLPTTAANTVNSPADKPDDVLKYQITASESQVGKLSFACDFVARVEIGQLKGVVDALPLRDDASAYELLLKLEEVVRPYLKRHTELTEFFTLYQTIRHRLSWDKQPAGGMTVNFDEPLKISDTPLIEISRLNGFNTLTQSIFDGCDDAIQSAHVNRAGIAFINECKAHELVAHDGQLECIVKGVKQIPVGIRYGNAEWEASAINRVF